MKKRYCPYCEKDITGKNAHLTKYKSKELLYEQIKYDYILYNFPQLTENMVNDSYNNKFYSLPDFKKQFGIDYKSMQFLLNYYNIFKRNISEGQKKSGIPKAKKTNLKKYGAENVLSKGTIIYKKRNETVKKRYGVNNVFQLENVKNKIEQTNIKKYKVKKPLQSEKIKKKVKQTNLKKYGVEWVLQADEIKEKIKQTKFNKYGIKNYNNIEKIKQTNLKRYGVEYNTQRPEIKKLLRLSAIKRKQIIPNYNPVGCDIIRWFNMYYDFNFQHAENGGEVCIDGYWPDGLDERRKTIIEVDEPRHFNSDGTLKEKDIRRQNYLEGLGYKFIRVKI